MGLIDDLSDSLRAREKLEIPKGWRSIGGVLFPPMLTDKTWNAGENASNTNPPNRSTPEQAQAEPAGESVPAGDPLVLLPGLSGDSSGDNLRNTSD